MFAVVLRTGVFRRPLQGIQIPREGKLQAEKGEEKRAAEYTMHSA